MTKMGSTACLENKKKSVKPKAELIQVNECIGRKISVGAFFWIVLCNNSACNVILSGRTHLILAHFFYIMTLIQPMSSLLLFNKKFTRRLLFSQVICDIVTEVDAKL